MDPKQGAKHELEQSEMQHRMHMNFVNYDSKSNPSNKKFKISNI